MDKRDEKHAIEAALHGAIGRAAVNHPGPFWLQRDMPMTAAILRNIEQAAAAAELVEALRVAEHRAEQATRGPAGAALDPITREWLEGIATAARAALEKAGDARAFPALIA